MESAVEMSTEARLPELLAGLVGMANVPNLPVAGLCLDSRELQPGDWFVATIGERQDGRRFVGAAAKAGAAGVLMEANGDRLARLSRVSIPVVDVPQLRRRLGVIAERFFGYPSQELEVVGVTGTNGKTSVSNFLSQALTDTELGPCGLIGTLGYGFPDRLEGGLTTTPDPLRLHRCLQQMRDDGAHAAAIEVSSHSLVQHRVAGVSFDVAVFTNLSRDHLDYHPSEEAYAAAKLRLFEDPNLAVAIVNFDDPFSRRIIDTLSAETRVFGYTTSAADLDLELAKYPAVSGHLRMATREGLTLAIDTPFGAGDITVPVFGEFNTANVLAVIATLLALDVPYETVIKRVARLRPVPGRFELFAEPGKPLVVVDYAHSPDALQQALASLRAMTDGNVFCVFGCGGERDPGKRELMGRIAEQSADRVIVTSDNPRREDPQQIAQQILSGCSEPGVVEIEHDRAMAISSAISAAAPRDAVLVAGKGHERYQEIGGERKPFDDRACVARLLEGGGR